MRPVDKDYPVSRPYGVPGDYAAGIHTGVDFECPIGTDVYAPQSGRVITSRYSEADYGHYVTVLWTPPSQHPKLFLVAHLSRRLVKVGDIVKRGDRIGLSGNTGNSRGPHVHAERRHAPFGYRDHERPPWK